MSDARSAVVRFAAFEVDLRSGELRRDGVRVPLQGQPFQILELLLARPGEIVTRDELRSRLWPDNTFVDFEHGLNAAIRRLRDALGDSAEAPRFVETIPRRGYRFIAPAAGGPPRSSMPPEEAADPPVPAPPGRRSFWMGAAAGLLSGIVLAGVVAVVWNRYPPPDGAGSTGAAGSDRAGAEPNRVAVAVFANRTVEPSLDPLGPLAADRIIRTATLVSGITVLPRAIDSGSDADEAVRIAHEAGASLLVSGAYYVNGGVLEFQARIVDPSSGRLLHAAAPEAGPLSSPADALRRLEQAVTGAIAMHFDDFYGGLPIVSHPPTLDAYREYRAGLEVFESDYQRSLGHLERAMAIDPGFLMPRIIAFFAVGNQGAHEEAEALLAAMEQEADRLAPPERLFVEYLRATYAGRHPQALRLLEDLEALAPASLAVNFNLVQQSLALNRCRAAVDAHDRLPTTERSLRHSIGTYRLDQLTRALHMLGDYDREQRESRLAQAYAPGAFRFLAAEARALAGLGRLDEVNRVIEESLAIPSVLESPGYVMAQTVSELLAHGHTAAARALAQRAVAWHERRSPEVRRTEDARVELARALYLAERWDDAQAAYSALLADRPDSVYYGAAVGLAAARRGDAIRARAISNELANLPSTQWGFPAAWRARIAALLGEPAEAVAFLRDAIASGMPITVILHSDPDLAPLLQYEPYLALIRPRD